MSDFHIRKASLKDVETLALIGTATFLESFVEEIKGPDITRHCMKEHSSDAYRTYLAKPGTECWLAEYSKTAAPIGYVMNCQPDLPVPVQDQDIELKRIYVFSRFHGSAVAEMLLQASVDSARKSAAPRLLLGTYEGNARATRFYEKHGFQTIGTRQFDVGGAIFNDIVMAKTL